MELYELLKHNFNKIISFTWLQKNMLIFWYCKTIERKEK
jgi:hypothetical protein